LAAHGLARVLAVVISCNIGASSNASVSNTELQLGADAGVPLISFSIKRQQNVDLSTFFKRC
jgi:hypothetical protein